MSLLHHVYQRLIAAGWKMLIWRTILAKKEMKDESSYMYWHRQLGMQVSSCSETVNNPYTYTCVDLYMASPLEKKQRTGSVNITQNMDCPVLWLLLDNELLSGRGGVTRFEGEGVRYRRERVPIGWRFNSANRKKKQTGLYCHQLKWTEELWLWTQLTKTPMIIMWPNSETKFWWHVSGSMMKCFIFIPLGVHFCSCDGQHKCWTAFRPFFCLSVSQGFDSALKCTADY